MKRLFLLLFFLGLMFFPLSGKLQAQTTESNQSVSLNVLGLEYVYEHALNRKFTIAGSGGLAAGLEWGNNTFDNDTKFRYLICPAVALESRYYYNIEKRFVKGKKTDGNAANFLSVQARYYIPWGIITSENMKIRNNAIVLTPSWGLRRILDSKWIFEINAGAYVWTHNFTVNPTANVRFGIMF